MCQFLGRKEADTKDGTLYFCCDHIGTVSWWYKSYKYIEESVLVFCLLSVDQIEEALTLRGKLQTLLKPRQSPGHDHYVGKLRIYLDICRNPVPWSDPTFDISLLEPWN